MPSCFSLRLVVPRGLFVALFVFRFAALMDAKIFSSVSRAYHRREAKIAGKCVLLFMEFQMDMLNLPITCCKDAMQNYFRASKQGKRMLP